MSDRPNIIWSNENLDYEDWQESLAEDYPDLTEAEREALMYELSADHLDDERTNLNIQLSQPILVIADLGRWNGRVMGYKEIPSGNIRDCLYSDTDYSTWYMDKLGDLRCDAIHHDGTNHYLYRTYKDGVTEEQIDRLKGKIYNGTATRADITRLTRRLGDEIARVYGWEISKPKVKQQEARYGCETMDKKTAICQYLKKYHTGGERAVYSRELQRLFSIDGRGLRRKINSLRQDGYPICSDERGYYCSLSASEADCICEPSVKIYGDGALLYTSPRISLDTYEDFDIQVDVTGVRKLKIEIMGVNMVIDLWPVYYPLVCITKAVIQR